MTRRHKRNRKNQKNRSQATQARLSMESLEPRQLMTASPGVSLDAGTLTIQGYGSRNDHVKLSDAVIAGHEYVSVTSYGSPFGSVPQIYKYQKANIDKIVFSGGRGNDTLSNQVSGVDVTFRGGAGTDRLIQNVQPLSILTNRDLTHATGYLSGASEQVDLFSVEEATLTGTAANDLMDASAFTGRVTLKGGKGNDTLIGGSGKDSLYGNRGDDTLYGKAGKDKLYGGLGNDTLYGNRGKDKLYGGKGKDVLYGGMGKDKLYGGNGNDTLHGNQGKDKLYGGNGNDRLLGGSGVDTLKGGNGNDGLIGGRGRDKVWGNDGQDRFLDLENDKIKDDKGEDVVISFVDRSDFATDYDGVTYTYTPGLWSDREMGVVDEAFAVLQKATGNTTLLKTTDGGERTYGRIGTSTSSFIAWGGDTMQHFGDGVFDGSDASAHHTVFHEMGHAWSIGTLAASDAWLEISGWTQVDQTGNPDYIAGNRGWFSETDKNFVRTYARTNPNEDFACHFAAYFTREAGESIHWIDSIETAPLKEAFIDDFIDSLK